MIYLNVRHLFLAVLVLGLTTAIYCLSARPAKEKIVERLIEDCPAWSALSASDDSSRIEILEYCKKISGYDLATVQKAMENYIMKKYASNSYDVACMSRLYVLNRFLFKVPDKAPFDRSTFGGWQGVPGSDKEINWLWPLSQDEKGMFRLTERFRGYKGHDYQAIQEFNFFKERFGSRK